MFNIFKTKFKTCPWSVDVHILAVVNAFGAGFALRDWYNTGNLFAGIVVMVCGGITVLYEIANVVHFYLETRIDPKEEALEFQRQIWATQEPVIDGRGELMLQVATEAEADQFQKEHPEYCGGIVCGDGVIIGAMCDDEQAQLRRVVGALKSCIDAHGPITKEWTGSAAKRVVKAMRMPTASNGRSDHRPQDNMGDFDEWKHKALESDGELKAAYIEATNDMMSEEQATRTREAIEEEVKVFRSTRGNYDT